MPLDIRIGCDPELFLRDSKTGAFVSGHGALPGTKMEPFRVPKGALQIDGTALEFNTDPASTCDEFVANIKTVMDEMRARVGPGLDLAAVPVAEYDREYFKTIPAEALELGCNPDFNAYTLDQNPVPDAAQMFRTGSGHVHIGWGENMPYQTEEYFNMCVPLVRQLDYYLGLASLLWDKDRRRRQLYGQAGSFRPKPYGLEYRVLSNKWLESERLQRFVFDAAVSAVRDLENGRNMAQKWSTTAMIAINSNYSDWRSIWPELTKDLSQNIDYSRIRA